MPAIDATYKSTTRSFRLSRWIYEFSNIFYLIKISQLFTPKFKWKAPVMPNRAP